MPVMAVLFAALLTSPPPARPIFLIPVQDTSQIPQAVVLARSIRRFGGAVAVAPVWLYVPTDLPAPDPEARAELADLRVEVRTFTPPPESRSYALGAKPFAAAQAEEAAAGTYDLLVLLDPNTIVLAEPSEMLLAPGKDLGFSPVNHQNVGSWYEEPPDAWWAAIYRVLGVPEDALWPMESLADRRVLRPYASAGSLVVRPEAGLMAAWARDFSALMANPGVAAASAEGRHNVFLHQAALAGTMVRMLPRTRMVQLSFRYNYPLFFDRIFGAAYPFDSLEEVVTMRYEFSFRDIPESWFAGVRSPPGVLTWIREQFAAAPGASPS